MARIVRGTRRAVLDLTLPAPRAIVRPLLLLFIGSRAVWHFVKRVFVCEPLFKAYCASYGKGVKTGTFIHWVQGAGRIVLGDQVRVDGKCSFSFSSLYSAEPTLEIGARTYIGHDCSFSIGRRVSIGEDCLLARGVWVFDMSGHPTDPEERRAGRPGADDKVKPVVIGDNVWVGSGSILLPGTAIGEGSVIAAGSVVRGTVPPYTIMSGNPATPIATLRPAVER